MVKFVKANQIILSRLKQVFINWDKSIFILILLLFVFLGFSYDSILESLPSGQHLWRQTDCLSITQHYAEGASFWEPEMHVQLADNNTSGKTAGEFPILYYIIGKVWSIFGSSLLIYRIIYLLILISGILALYKSLKIILKSSFWSISLTLLFISSPVYIFYSANFLTDGPAYSFVLIAIYFFIKYNIYSKKHLLYLTITFFSLAGLIKVSSLIAFVFLGSIYVLELLPIKTLNKRKLFQNPKFEILLFILVPLFVISWYTYAHFYNEAHHFKYTFNNIFPLWEMNRNEIASVIERVISFSSYLFFSRPLLLMTLGICIINIFSWKKINLLAYLTNLILLTGSIIYFILWAPLMGEHDYYYIALLILLPSVFIPFFLNLKLNYSKILNSIITKSIFAVFLFYNLWYCASLVQLKGHSRIGDNSIIMNQPLLDGLKWCEWDNTSNIYRMYRIRPELDKLGIKTTDKIIVIPDDSFNTTLYMINRKGWSNFMHYSNSSDIEYLKQKGAKYLFILNDSYLNEMYLQPFLTNEIENFEGVRIYKL